jgi:hypothetical protein
VPPVLPARISSSHSVLPSAQPAQRSSVHRFGASLVQEAGLVKDVFGGAKALVKTMEFDATKGFNTALFGSGLKAIGSENRIQDIRKGRVEGRSVAQQTAQEVLIISTIGFFTFLVKGALPNVSPVIDFMILAGAYQASEVLSRYATGAYDKRPSILSEAQGKHTGSARNEKTGKTHEKVSTALHTSSLPGLSAAPVVLDLDPLSASSVAALPSVRPMPSVGLINGSSQPTSLFSSGINPSPQNQLSFTPSSSSQPVTSTTLMSPAFSLPSTQVNPFFVN